MCFQLLLMFDGHGNHWLQHVQIINGPPSTRHCAVPVGILRKQLKMVAPRISIAKCANVSTLVTAFPNLRQTLNFQLFVRWRKSVGVTEAFAVNRFVQKTSRTACYVRVLVNVRWVDAGKTAATCRTLVVRNANDRTAVPTCIERQGF